MRPRVRSPFIKALLYGVAEPEFPVETKVVPDQALRPVDVVNRYLRGQPMPEPAGSAKPVYIDDMTHDSPDLNKMAMYDKMESADFVRSLKVQYKKPKYERKMTKEEFVEESQVRLTAEEWRNMPPETPPPAKGVA